MKFRVGSTLLLLPLFLAGCATTPPLVMSGSVGPAPRVEAVSEKQGTLVVYSVWDIFPGGDSDYHYREDYVLSWPGDAHVRTVRNHAGTFEEGPVSVSLPPGRYQIRARAAGYGKVTANVVIEAGRTTIVWLDGTGPKDAVAPTAAQVRLPNGQMIGWRVTR